MLTPEVASKIATLRAKAVDNTLTLEEMREGIALIREDRKSAFLSSEHKGRAKAKKAIPSGEDLLARLG